MEDLRNRMTDIQVKQEVLNVSFADHKVQNEKDFTAVDHEIAQVLDAIKQHRVESTAQAAEMRHDILELKKFMWKTIGVLSLAVPLLNWLAGKLL